MEKEKIIKMVNPLFIGITFFQLLLWYNWFEMVTYAVADKSIFQRLIFITLSIGAGALLWRYVKTQERIAKSILYGVITFFLLNTIISLSNTYVASYSGSMFDDTSNIIYNYCEGNELLSDYKLLYENQENNIYIIGKKRSLMKNYIAVYPSVYFRNSHNINYILPKDFNEYSEYLRYYKYNIEEKNVSDFRDFISWQFPDYIFFIARNKSGNFEITEYNEQSVDIGYVRPFLFSIFTGEIIDRYRSFINIVVYTFNSPHYRTDLIDDPYFLIWRGEIDKAKENMNKLPENRRKFIENKLKSMGEL